MILNRVADTFLGIVFPLWLAFSMVNCELLMFQNNFFGDAIWTLIEHKAAVKMS